MSNNLLDAKLGKHKEVLDLNHMGLDESEDSGVLNEEVDDVTELESNNIEDNLDDLQALISDTHSTQLFISFILTIFRYSRRQYQACRAREKARSPYSY
jgi:hypothetical protein